MKTTPFLGIICLSILLMTACTQSVEPSLNEAAADKTTKSDKGQASVDDSDSEVNILQLAASSIDHTILVAAVQAAELENVLANAGPLTVFAPNNAAFEALPAGTVDELLKPENKAKLSAIIKYHAAPGNYQGELLKDGMKLYQASGHYVEVQKDGDHWVVAGARILGTLQASNGVVHVVDKVMLPPQ